jgi:MFS family permease
LTYGVIGGTGTGLVYATCVNIVAKWYPEAKGSRVGFVNGGFAYGSIPFIIIFSYWFTVSNHAWVLALVGAFMMVVICTCGFFLKDPPMNWWPAEVDPLNWQQNQAAARNLKKNPPAARQFTPNEALRQWQIYAMWVALTLTAGVSLFGISFESKFAKDSGFAVYVAVLSAIMLALVNGTGRALVGWMSDRIGRKPTLILICVILGLAQWGVGWSGTHQNEALFFLFAIITGFGSGAFYPMFAMLTPDYFGENYNSSNYGVVYSGKAVGAVCAPLGAAFVTHNGYGATFVLAGALSLLAAVLVLTLRRPTVPVVTSSPANVPVAAGESEASATP